MKKDKKKESLFAYGYLLAGATLLSIMGFILYGGGDLGKYVYYGFTGGEEVSFARINTEGDLYTGYVSKFVSVDGDGVDAGWQLNTPDGKSYVLANVPDSIVPSSGIVEVSGSEDEGFLYLNNAKALIGDGVGADSDDDFLNDLRFGLVDFDNSLVVLSIPMGKNPNSGDYYTVGSRDMILNKLREVGVEGSMLSIWLPTDYVCGGGVDDLLVNPFEITGEELKDVDIAKYSKIIVASVCPGEGSELYGSSYIRFGGGDFVAPKNYAHIVVGSPEDMFSFIK